MQEVKTKRKPRILETLKRKYDGSEIRGFDVILDMVMNARTAKEATKLLMPLLRQRLVLINPERTEAVEIVEERNEPVIKVHLLTKVVRITRYEITVEPVLIYTPNPWC